MTIIICHNILSDRKWVWTVIGMNWVGGWHHPRRDGPEKLRILKRQCSWGRLLKVAVWVFWIRSDQIIFFGSQPAEVTWNLKHHKTYHTLGVNICFYDLCLSPHQGLKVERDKLVRTTCICKTVVIDIFMSIIQINQ